MKRVYTDSELIAGVLGGTSSAFAQELYGRYWDFVCNVCRQFEKDAARSHELACEVMSTVFEKLDSFRNTALFSTWLHAVASNHCKGYLRKKLRQPLFETMELVSDICFDEADADDAKYTILLQAIDLLPELDKRVYELRFVQGLSLKEIALKLGKGESAVKMHIKRIKQRLALIVLAKL